MKTRLLLLLMTSPSMSRKLINYSDVLKELSDQKLGNSLIKEKSVAELLKMSQEYHHQSDQFNPLYSNNYQPLRSKLFTFSDDLNTDDDDESDDPFYTNIKVYHQDYVQPDSIEKRMENMLGKDFFEDKKFILFLLLTFILVLLSLSCSIVAIRWCYRTFIISKNNAGSSLVRTQVYQPISVAAGVYGSHSPPTLFTDLDTSTEHFPHDTEFLQGRKLYPGVL